LKKKIIPFYIYTILIILSVVLDINNSDNQINDIYIFEIRLDIIAHFMIFFVWVIFLKFTYSLSIFKLKKLVLISIIIGFLFAFFAELIQYYLPYRAFNINDMIGNFLGIFFGSLIFLKK